MGRQGRNDGGGGGDDDDDDDDNTMDNPKHIWPSTFTELHNLSFKVNSRLQMIPYILYYCSITLWPITEQDQEKDYMHFKENSKGPHQAVFHIMYVLHDNILTLYFYT
jgi:hypothetical protein